MAGTREYLVEWVGYTSDDASWEPECNLMPETIETYMDEMEDLGEVGEDDLDEGSDIPDDVDGFSRREISSSDMPSDVDGAEESGDDAEGDVEEGNEDFDDDGALLNDQDAEWAHSSRRRRTPSKSKNSASKKSADTVNKATETQKQNKSEVRIVNKISAKEVDSKKVQKVAQVEEKHVKTDDKKKRSKSKADDEGNEQALGMHVYSAMCVCVDVSMS
jgi:hypothetical protein